MQGQRSSTSSGSGVNSQMSWNNGQTSVTNLLPDYMISLNDPNVIYLHHMMHEGQTGEWSVGEASSSAAETSAVQNDGKSESTRNIHFGAALSSDIIDLDPNENQFLNGTFPVNNSSSVTLPQDLNVGSGYENNKDDECQIIERPNTSMTIGSLNDQMIPILNSSDSSMRASSSGGNVMGGRGTSPVPLDGRRRTCKRKASEIVGQSSVSGNSNSRYHSERSGRHAQLAAQISIGNNGVSAEAEQSNTRLRLGGEPVIVNSFPWTASGTPENSNRNVRSRRNGLQRQDSVPFVPFSTNADSGIVEISPPRRSSRSIARNRIINLNPAPEAEDGNARAQSALLRGHSSHLMPQSNRYEVSNSRTSRPSSSSIAGGRDGVISEDSMFRTAPRTISDHPIFVPARERRSSALHPTSWNFIGGSSGISENLASSSFIGSSSGVNSSSPWIPWSNPQYSHRLADMVQRSLISSTGTEPGGQSSNHPVRPGSLASSQEVAQALLESANHDHQTSNSRYTLFGRHLDGAFTLPYSTRTLAYAGEGRSSMMSEIRHVLELMRRGENLRAEDMMILDHPFLFGLADLNDRHRDMRLDVDNMSYEELLALEERIGNVSTGLIEETIIKGLKTCKYINIEPEKQDEAEPCCICREEYVVGEDLGRLGCGHDFHRDCIKQWLMQKNVCPICKTPGIAS